ncbi:poly-gamma-glutamate synthase PgsB [bacterium]|nr:poly-gamma-glutamate synthase PgsB [bacterium]
MVRLILFLLVLLTALGTWEMARHARHRRRIGLRIHVNGSRGKSSVARLIAAGLRAGGLAVVAKTTGSAAAVINTDGSESPIARRGGPNIKEQLAVFRTAAAQSCDALVLECMAVRPDLQRACEHGIVHATHGVITNVRPDHLEVMGPTLDDVAASLAGTVPRHARLYTAEDRYTGYLAARARRAGSSCTAVGPENVGAADMADFTYDEFAENVALALAVCEDVGVDRATALAGMRGVTPDVGALTRRACPHPDGGTVEFINGFAANDNESYRRVWRRLGLDAAPDEVVVLVNTRADRRRRSQDLAPLFGRELRPGHQIVIGDDAPLYARLVRGAGAPATAVTDAHDLDAPALWQAVLRLARPGARVIGVGNIAGIGHQLLAHLAQEAPQSTPARPHGEARA